MERLTEEIQIGPFATLKNKAEAKAACANLGCILFLVLGGVEDGVSVH